MNPICPYCRTEVGEAEGERQDCPGCGAPHHADCFAENGGCTVFGCANAPTDEAKVTVSATDMMGNMVTREVAAPQPAAPTPTPSARPRLTLGAGFTTFQAPALDPTPQPQPQGPAAGPIPPPPPPPPGGTGVAPPPQTGALPQVPAAAPVYYIPPPQPKTRVVFVLLGIFLGALGIHNFYAGYIKKAALQLCLTLLTVGWGAVVSWPWAIIEICVINKDAEGTQFV